MWKPLPEPSPFSFFALFTLFLFAEALAAAMSASVIGFASGFLLISARSFMSLCCASQSSCVKRKRVVQTSHGRFHLVP